MWKRFLYLRQGILDILGVVNGLKLIIAFRKNRFMIQYRWPVLDICLRFDAVAF